MDFSTINLTWVTGAAVVGFVGSLTVAIVNVLAARRLERAKSLRAYRAESVAQCRQFISANAIVVGNMRRLAPIPDRFQAAAEKWLASNADPSDKFGAVYTPGPVKSPFMMADTAQSLLHKAALALLKRPTDENRKAVRDTGQLCFDAYALIEKSTELFVYGGVWTRVIFEIRSRQLRRKLKPLSPKQSSG